MPKMVRKQILLDAALERSLEKAAAGDGVSQGEFIRRAVSDTLGRREAEARRSEAWERLERSMTERAAAGPAKGGRSWKREDLYDR